MSVTEWQLLMNGVVVAAMVVLVVKLANRKPVQPTFTPSTTLAVPTSEVDFHLLMDAVMSASPGAVIMVDANGMIEKANHACYIVTGWPESLVGQHLNALIPERFRTIHATHRVGFMDDSRVRQMGVGKELFLRHHDGKDIEVKIGLTPLTQANGTKHVVAYISPASPA